MTRTIIALDFPTGAEALELLDRFDEPVYAKIGMELFYSEGPAIVKAVKERGHEIFLDLKLHDIPNTVKSAMKQLAALDVDMVNVHAAGGKKMMEAAIEGLKEGSEGRGKRPLCIAVTQLTSTSQEMLNQEIRIPGNIADVAEQYARLARKAGLDGVDFSVLEAKKIHRSTGENILTVTPGIRPSGTSKDDQARVATPKYAKLQGCDFIVVGRPITRAEDPVAAYKAI